MNKKLGVLVVLSLLVLSISFSSVGWFSDIWNKISEKRITGNAISDLECNSLMPVYRLWNEDFKDHFYTINNSERENAISNYGYSDEGILGYVYSNQVSGTGPLYRLYNAQQNNHFYTTGVNEKNNAINKFKYRDEGILGYVYSNQVSGTGPLYRLYNAQQNNHFYTTEINERDRAIDRGYKYENIGGYIFNSMPIQCSPQIIIPTCNSFVYEWSECSNGIQTANVISKSPINCEGGNPLKNRSCEILSEPICTVLKFRGVNV